MMEMTKEVRRRLLFLGEHIWELKCEMGKVKHDPEARRKIGMDINRYGEEKKRLTAMYGKI